MKVLHHSHLKNSVKSELWNSNNQGAFEQSIDIKSIPASNQNISKLIISGKFKKKKLSEVYTQRAYMTSTEGFTKSLSNHLQGSLRVFTSDEDLNNQGIFSPKNNRDQLDRLHSPDAGASKTGTFTSKNNLDEDDELEIDPDDYRDESMEPNPPRQEYTNGHTKAEFLPLRSIFEQENPRLEHEAIEPKPAESFERKQMNEFATNDSLFESSFADEPPQNNSYPIKGEDEAPGREMAETIQGIYEMMDDINQQG